MSNTFLFLLRVKQIARLTILMKRSKDQLYACVTSNWGILISVKRGGGEQGDSDTQAESEEKCCPGTKRKEYEPVEEIKMSKEAKCEALEKTHVHDVYANTAHHFTGVRYKAWPRVKKFILELEPGSIVADVGALCFSVVCCLK